MERRRRSTSWCSRRAPASGITSRPRRRRASRQGAPSRHFPAAGSQSHGRRRSAVSRVREEPGLAQTGDQAVGSTTRPASRTCRRSRRSRGPRRAARGARCRPRRHRGGRRTGRPPGDRRRPGAFRGPRQPARLSQDLLRRTVPGRDDHDVRVVRREAGRDPSGNHRDAGRPGVGETGQQRPRLVAAERRDHPAAALVARRVVPPDDPVAVGRDEHLLGASSGIGDPAPLPAPGESPPTNRSGPPRSRPPRGGPGRLGTTGRSRSRQP